MKISQILKENEKIKQCQWCSHFVGNKGRATIREPNIFYCESCYQKGVQMENEAMFGDCLINCRC